MLASLFAALLATSVVQAQELEAPHTWRAGITMGVGGTLAESQAVAQLGQAFYELEVTSQGALSVERWVLPWIGVGADLLWHRLRMGRAVAPSSDSVFDTFALMIHAVVATRGSPTSGGGEAALEVAAGPALVHWAHREESTSAAGLVVRAGGRLGQGLHLGFAWSLRPWIGTEWAVIGPADLTSAGVSAGIDLHAGWGW